MFQVKMSPWPDASPASDALAALRSVVIGKDGTVRLALAALLAGGHLLLEGPPGTGKTTLARALATVFGLSFQRVQFTSDLLPADLLGGLVAEPGSGPIFRPGPVFTQILLADELNRGSPRTQSALLEAMEERQVSYDGVTRPLPQPFMVIATQNPLGEIGTAPLPESQVDRFMARLRLELPEPAAERALLCEGAWPPRVLPQTLRPETFGDLQHQARELFVGAAVLDYVQALLAAVRLRAPVSVRAGQALVACARGLALLERRGFVAPDDIQDCAQAVLAHRLEGAPGQNLGALDAVLAEVPIP